MRVFSRFRNLTKLSVLALMPLAFACSQPGASRENDQGPLLSSTPVLKKKNPEPETKPEIHFECAFLNGEGRVFRAGADTRAEAESMARQDCQIFSRHCSILDCKQD